MQLSGNTVLITGGTSGIGLAFAMEFARLGNRVILCGRRKDRLADIQAKHPAIAVRPCDVSKAEQRSELARWVVDEFPQLNVLINNAGIQLATEVARPVEMARLTAEIDTNLVAPIHLASLLVPQLSAQPRSAIINITSGLAFAPTARMPVYCATKAALHTITMCLRHQLRNTPIRIFEIAPPAVDTELGLQNRSDPASSHGGMPVAEFVREAMEALRPDTLEAPIGQAKNLRAKGEAMFPIMNPG